MGKKENAQILDPMRFKIAQQNAVIPGGPENNNPMNVTDNASPVIQGQSIYGDYAQAYPQMGTGMVNKAYGCWTFWTAAELPCWPWYEPSPI